jgi:hypothetical protein
LTVGSAPRPRRCGWTYLFRVQAKTKLITRDGQEHTLEQFPKRLSY